MTSSTCGPGDPTRSLFHQFVVVVDAPPDWLRHSVRFCSQLRQPICLLVAQAIKLRERAAITEHEPAYIGLFRVRGHPHHGIELRVIQGREHQAMDSR
jgi:hypothetical protein